MKKYLFILISIMLFSCERHENNIDVDNSPNLFTNIYNVHYLNPIPLLLNDIQLIEENDYLINSDSLVDRLNRFSSDDFKSINFTFIEQEFQTDLRHFYKKDDIIYLEFYYDSAIDFGGISSFKIKKTIDNIVFISPKGISLNYNKPKKSSIIRTILKFKVKDKNKIFKFFYLLPPQS